MCYMVIMCQSINVIGPSISKVYQIGVIHSGRQSLSVLHKNLQLARSIVEIQIQASLLFRLLKLYHTIYLPIREGNQAHRRVVVLIHKIRNLQNFSFIHSYIYSIYFMFGKKKKKVRHKVLVGERSKQSYRNLQAAYNLEIEFQV